MSFELHRQLASDCHVLGRFDSSHVLLHRNSLFHWFIVVPETSLTDFLDLAPPSRSTILDHCALLSEILKKKFHYPKINFASIGNVVPQLHLHVIGRSPDDSLWPAPVWGNIKSASEYTRAQLDELEGLLRPLSRFEPAS